MLIEYDIQTIQTNSNVIVIDFHHIITTKYGGTLERTLYQTSCCESQQI